MAVFTLSVLVQILFLLDWTVLGVQLAVDHHRHADLNLRLILNLRFDHKFLNFFHFRSQDSRYLSPWRRLCFLLILFSTWSFTLGRSCRLPQADLVLEYICQIIDFSVQF